MTTSRVIRSPSAVRRRSPAARSGVFPRVARCAVAAILEHDELVVGRLAAIRLGDRVASVERPDRHADELHLGVVAEALEHRSPVSRPDAVVERDDVLVEQAHARTSGLYLMRCGSSASAPRVSFTQSA